MSQTPAMQKEPKNMTKESGQIIIILLLTMLVALTIGLSLVQSSITDLASSAKTEQATRAFSAAEAGIEKALNDSTATLVSSSETGNQSQATVTVDNSVPSGSVDALEYPPIGKADLAHFWLIDPADESKTYKRNDVVIYFGNTGTDFDSSNIPAIEVNLITRDNDGNYVSRKSYYDPVILRASTNKFTLVPSSDCSASPGMGVTTSYSSPSTQERFFYCKQSLTVKYGSEEPMLIRLRVLNSSRNQSVAVSKGSQPCNGAGCTLPAQATLYTAVGTAGQTEKTITVFKERNVVLPFFDFAIFSNSSITK